MKVSLKSNGSPENYLGVTDNGHQTSISGNKKATSPMQLVLMSMAGCSAIDIEHILKKMRQPLESIHVDVEGKRQDDHPRVFTEIHMHYTLKGDLKESKVKKAIELSLGKYCSVSKMIEKAAVINSSFDIID